MWIVMHPRPRLILLLLIGMVLACPAWAQFGGGQGQGSIATGGAAARAGGPAQRPEPAALPGAGSRGPAPISKPPSEMDPNEALFDAINRDDLEAARGATTRGADLNARNVLGLTPLELAVDLGQNDIAFLLLSLRDAGPSGRPTTQTGGRTAAGHPAPTPAPRRPAPAPRAITTVSRPAQSDGGAPVPNAGFLGFGR
jgi:hypothetical protein